MYCKGRVTHKKGLHSIANAKLVLFDELGKEVKSTLSDDDGYYAFSEVPVGKYKLQCKHFGVTAEKDVEIPKDHDCEDAHLDLDLGLQLSLLDADLTPVTAATERHRVIIRAESKVGKHIEDIKWKVLPETHGVQSTKAKSDYEIVVPHDAEPLTVEAEVIDGSGARAKISSKFHVLEGDTHKVAIKGRVALKEPVGVRLHRTASDPTEDQVLWVAIRNRARAVSFERYQGFMNCALLLQEQEIPRGIQAAARELERDVKELGAHLHGVSAYQTLKVLTETFLLLECGVRIQHTGKYKVPFDPEAESRRLGRQFSREEMERKLREYLGDRAQLPYITNVAKAAYIDLEREGSSNTLIQAKINEPILIELIWSYWMEEGMLVQTMNAVSQRFQNVRAGERDPLANLEIDPLRPLNNLLWGYIQDEYNRLSVRRRAYEYVHHYGLTLYGKATAGMRSADTRSKFLEAFHNLLYQASVFFKEDFQTTVIADGFPLLKALTEVHLILAQGAHNQFGDLPWTARVEMLLMQFMLARREIRDFLQARIMVPYREPWEPQVDAMKTLQGWTDVTVSHFRDLAVYGEQLLLSIRYGDWIADNDEYSAINWARYFRPEIQGYLHAYRAVTGLDMTQPDQVDATIPGIHLQNRTAMQRAR